MVEMRVQAAGSRSLVVVEIAEGKLRIRLVGCTTVRTKSLTEGMDLESRVLILGRVSLRPGAIVLRRRAVALWAIALGRSIALRRWRAAIVGLLGRIAATVLLSALV